MAGIRERVRAELTAEIKAIARRQMAAEGTGSLSLRAVARELGLASSAIYRYFPSRDELLTALIIDSYNELGQAAEMADAGMSLTEAARADVHARWWAVADSAYRWAKDHPAEYGLLFGTPIPGYAAPPDTIGPASRFTFVLLQILDEASRAGIEPAVVPTVPASVTTDLVRLRGMAGVEIGDEMLLAGMQVWMALFGTITFVLFGQLQNVIVDLDAFFDSAVSTLGRQVFGPVLPSNEKEQ